MTHHRQKSLRKIWDKKQFKQLDIAFQPIVNIHTGICYGYEALLKEKNADGGPARQKVFHRIYSTDVIGDITVFLYEKAVEKYVNCPSDYSAKLFFNLDSRVLKREKLFLKYHPEILKKYHLNAEAVCFEITEEPGRSPAESLERLKHHQAKGSKIGLNNFGSGISEFHVFYTFNPDFIKIAPFFFKEALSDPKKQLVLSSMINIAHTLGVVVIAVGICSRQEFYLCRNVGIDLVQGDFIQPPQTDIATLAPRYEHIHQLVKQDARNDLSDQNLIRTEMETIPTISSQIELSDMFDIFREHKRNTFFPVLNPLGEPLGVVRETVLKRYIYHRYGRELLKNPGSRKKLEDFMTEIPIADIHTSVEKILEIFSMNSGVEGILIVDNMRYMGFLSAKSLLKVLNEKKLTLAREQNPLTKLPGNTVIHEYVSKALDNTGEMYALAYFDFDHFKPFNDKYGFRIGDRIIVLFADLLKVQAHQLRCFIGHIGGDDFFMGLHDVPFEKAERVVQELTQQFQHDAESFYGPEDLERGYIFAKDREGKVKKFQFLTVSAVLLRLTISRPTFTTEHLSNILATLKKHSKRSPNGICIADICEY